MPLRNWALWSGKLRCKLGRHKVVSCVLHNSAQTTLAELQSTGKQRGFSGFLVRCLDPAGARPTAMELLEDPFFVKPKLPPPEQVRRPSGLPQMEPEGDPHHRGANHHQQDGGGSSEGEEACEVGYSHSPVLRHAGVAALCPQNASSSQI